MYSNKPFKTDCLPDEIFGNEKTQLAKKGRKADPEKKKKKSGAVFFYLQCRSQVHCPNHLFSMFKSSLFKNLNKYC